MYLFSSVFLSSNSIMSYMVPKYPLNLLSGMSESVIHVEVYLRINDSLI